MKNRRVAFLGRDIGRIEFVDPSKVAQDVMSGVDGVAQKRGTLMQSQKLPFWAKEDVLKGLYKATGANMTLGELQVERIAILESDLGEYGKLDVLEQLYKSAGACITGDGLKAERNEVMALDWLERNKIPLLNALYAAILPRLTGDIVVRECEAILGSSIANKQKFRLAKMMFDSCTHYTMSDIKKAHTVVKNARLESEEKQVLVQLVCDFILQTLRLEMSRLEGVAAKRDLILKTGLPADQVITLLVALYEQYFSLLSLDDIFREYNAIAPLSRCFNPDGILQQLFKGAEEPLAIENVAVLREDLLQRRYSVSLTVLYERLDELLSADDIAVERQALLASGFYEDSIAALLVSLYESQRDEMTFELMQAETDAIIALGLESHNKTKLLQQLFNGVKKPLPEEQVYILLASIREQQLKEHDQAALVIGLYQALSGNVTVAFVQRERAVILSSKLPPESQARLLGGLYNNSIAGRLVDALGEREALYACEEISENRVLFLATLYKEMKQRRVDLADTLSVLYERIGDQFTPEVFRTERDAITRVNEEDEANWEATYMTLLQHGCECLKPEEVSLERAFLMSVKFGCRWKAKPLSNTALSECLTVLYTKSAQSLALDVVHDELDALMSSRLGDLDIFRLARLMFSSVHSKMPVEWIHSERAWLIAQVKNVNALDAADAEEEHDDWEYTRDYPPIGLFDPWFIAHRIVNLYQASGTLLDAGVLQEERATILASDMDRVGRAILLRELYSHGSVRFSVRQMQEERAAVLSPEFYGENGGEFASSYAAASRLELLQVLYGTHSHCLTGDVFQEERDALLQADLPDESRAMALAQLY
ncbi:MAG: hypothetical protein O3A01_08370, partial [bacterium]|nr:hypothetical protein [bacterium]